MSMHLFGCSYTHFWDGSVNGYILLQCNFHLWKRHTSPSYVSTSKCQDKSAHEQQNCHDQHAVWRVIWVLSTICRGSGVDFSTLACPCHPSLLYDQGAKQFHMCGHGHVLQEYFIQHACTYWVNSSAGNWVNHPSPSSCSVCITKCALNNDVCLRTNASLQ